MPTLLFAHTGLNSVLKTFEAKNRAHVFKIAHMLAKIAHCVLFFVFVKRFQGEKSIFIKKFT